MDDNGGIPEDLRCKRSDGKQWRCNALSMADKTVCEKHYYQAKKRAASSAMRATTIKKAKKNGIEDADEEPELSTSLSPANNGESGELSGSVDPAKKKKLREALVRELVSSNKDGSVAFEMAAATRWRIGGEVYANEPHFLNGEAARRRQRIAFFFVSWDIKKSM